MGLTIELISSDKSGRLLVCHTLARRQRDARHQLFFCVTELICVCKDRQQTGAEPENKMSFVT